MASLSNHKWGVIFCLLFIAIGHLLLEFRMYRSSAKSVAATAIATSPCSIARRDNPLLNLSLSNHSIKLRRHVRFNVWLSPFKECKWTAPGTLWINQEPEPAVDHALGVEGGSPSAHPFFHLSLDRSGLRQVSGELVQHFTPSLLTHIPFRVRHGSYGML